MPSVTMNSSMPSAKAASVLGLSNSVSPISSVTIWSVMVVTLSSGLIVSLAIRPAAITTIIVSPMARLTARRTPPTMPGMAAGNSTFIIVSPRVAPSASDPSRSDRGTAERASSAKEEMNGISMIAQHDRHHAACGQRGVRREVQSEVGAGLPQERRDRQDREEAVDDGRDARQDLEHRLDDVARARRREFVEVDRGE